MRKVITSLLLCIVAQLLIVRAEASPSAAAALEQRVVEYRLPNGMLWLLVRREGAPVFTGVVQVKVGGNEEVPGRSGLAHMFEHMAFKGNTEIGTRDFAKESILFAKIRAAEVQGNIEEAMRLSEEARQYVVPNELWHLFHKNGAEELNAFTGKDLTTYYARMPANMLPLWAYLTSEMVGYPVLREFYQERNVVMEERRSSTDANPHGKLYEALLQTAFTDSPYRRMTIGSMKDLEQITLTDAEKFHAAYYRPDRMVGAVVGMFDIEQAKQSIRQFFGRLPADPSPKLLEKARPEYQAVESQTAERRVAVPFPAEPALLMAFHKPSLPHRDDYVFDVLLTILCDGSSSRLHKRLVQTDRSARDVDCESSSPGGRLSNLFLIQAQPIAPHTNRELEATIEHELGRLRTEPVAAAELEKARNNIASDFLWGISTNEGLAQQLVYFQTIADDWRYIIHHGDVVATITAEDVRRVANTYLIPTNRTTAELVKK